MAADLSCKTITSFCGDVLPLHLSFDSQEHKTLAQADISWYSDNTAVRVRDFAGEDRMCFRNGVLLELCSVGNATVTATYEGQEYTCAVTVVEPKTCTSEEATEYYVGDLHDHTSVIHGHDDFADRDCEFQSEYIDYIKKENLIDFGVISDHAGVINDTDFFRGFTEERKAQPMDVIVFPGVEAEVTFRETDRFGILHNNGGEIVTFNSAGYSDAKSFEEFISAYKDSPAPVAVFAHPQIIGFSTQGVWNFSYDKNNTPEMLRLIRGIEMGDGSDRQQNLIHEYVYSVALDNGFRISTTCSSDSHGNPAFDGGTRWGYQRFPGKTIIMAREKSKEAFIDALRHNRFYGSESGNLKIRYTVNGSTAPADLVPSDTYHFAVSLSYFHDDLTSCPIGCRVISDGGETLLTLTDIDFSNFSFDITAPDARYFYLRFVDEKGRRTWSVPVWTGRPFEKKGVLALTPVSVDGFTVIDTVSGKDAAVAIDGDPANTWIAEGETASLVVDMQSEYEISAVGLYPRIINRVLPSVDPKRSALPFMASLATEYALSVSLDGEHYKTCAKGICRVFGAENIISFPKCRARYMRLDLLSTVGRDLAPRGFEGEKLAIGNLSIFA